MLRLHLQVAKELTQRMDMFERLTVLSGLLVSISRTLLNEARNAQPTAAWERTAAANLIVAAVCLTANIWSMVIILMQRVSR